MKFFKIFPIFILCCAALVNAKYGCILDNDTKRVLVEENRITTDKMLDSMSYDKSTGLFCFRDRYLSNHGKYQKYTFRFYKVEEGSSFWREDIEDCDHDVWAPDYYSYGNNRKSSYLDIEVDTVFSSNQAHCVDISYYLVKADGKGGDKIMVAAHEMEYAGDSLGKYSPYYDSKSCFYYKTGKDYCYNVDGKELVNNIVINDIPYAWGELDFVKEGSSNGIRNLDFYNTRDSVTIRFHGVSVLAYKLRYQKRIDDGDWETIGSTELRSVTSVTNNVIEETLKYKVSQKKFSGNHVYFRAVIFNRTDDSIAVTNNASLNMVYSLEAKTKTNGPETEGNIVKPVRNAKTFAKYGSKVVIQASSLDGYQFKNWVNASGMVMSTENPAEIIVTKDTVLYATFTKTDLRGYLHFCRLNPKLGDRGCNLDTTTAELNVEYDEDYWSISGIIYSPYKNASLQMRLIGSDSWVTLENSTVANSGTVNGEIASLGYNSNMKLLMIKISSMEANTNDKDNPLYAYKITEGYDLRVANYNDTKDTLYTNSIRVNYRYRTVYLDKNGKDTLMDTLLAYGEKALCDPKINFENTDEYEYRFYWNPEVKAATDNMTYKLVVESKPLYYDVVFYGYNKSGTWGIISVQNVKAGMPAQAPQVFEVEGVKFREWSKSFDSVTENLSVFGVYLVEKNVGNVIQSSSSSVDVVESSSSADVVESSSSEDVVESDSSKEVKSSSSKHTKSKIDAVEKFLSEIKLSVRVVDKEIQISNAKVGNEFALMDLQGRVLATGHVKFSEFRLKVYEKGIFILRIGNRIQKLNIK